MASAGSELCDKELLSVCDQFVLLSMTGKTPAKGAEHQMTTKACGRMMKDCGLQKMSTTMDASCFPKHKVKGKQYLEMDKVGNALFMQLAEIEAKNKCKGTAKPDKAAIDAEFTRICKCITDHGAPKLKELKVSAAAAKNLEKMTDTDKYTGAHVQRFDKDGKGAGKGGREDICDTQGYVTGSKLKK